MKNRKILALLLALQLAFTSVVPVHAEEGKENASGYDGVSVEVDSTETNTGGV